MSAPLHFHSGAGGEVCSQGWSGGLVLSWFRAVAVALALPPAPPHYSGSPCPPGWQHPVSVRVWRLELPSLRCSCCVVFPAPLRKGRLPSGLMRLHRTRGSDSSRPRLLRQSPSKGSTAIWLWGVCRPADSARTMSGVPGHPPHCPT